jgi:hypothetical protein
VKASPLGARSRVGLGRDKEADVIHLNDKRLWGNEAADDEDPSVLNSYFVSQPQFHIFFDSTVRLSIARARKGMGKSALLRECAYRVSRNSKVIVVAVKGADLVAQQPFKPLTADEHIYDWEQRICMAINRQLGSEIGFAVNDDQVVLVESAELAGFKRRNLVGMLVDRLKGKLGQVEVQKLEAKDHRALLKRTVEEDDWSVWLLVDDIDATFLNTPEQCLRLSTFFSACRDLASSFRGVVVRTCVRTDVWTSIRKTDEALDKVEQYVFDINWSQRHTGLILAERVASYMQRYGDRQMSYRRRLIAEGAIMPAADDQYEPRLDILGEVFPSQFPWGRGRAMPHRVIHVYSAGRPRWAAQLCRMAGDEAVKVRSDFIKFGHITQVLESYGRFRLDDIGREHRHQCEQISDVVNAFSRQRRTYSTDQIIDFIKKTILRNVNVMIDGQSLSDGILLARFLFRIGFLVGKFQAAEGSPEYFRFEEKPDLLKTYANPDDGLKWHIHPSFHAALELSD